MTANLLIVILATSVMAGTPILLASLGEILAERAGILNLGVEGMMLAGAGGAYLSLVYAPAWLENMTAGRGWIAIALVIFAAWNPLYALAGSYLFGGIDALSLRLQAMNVMVSPFFLKMLPYLFTLLVLVLVTRKSTSTASVPPRLSGCLTNGKNGDR